MNANRCRRIATFLTLLVIIPMAVLLETSPASAEPYFYRVVRSNTDNRCLDNDADTNGNARTNVQLYDCWTPISDWQVWESVTIRYQPADIFKIRNVQSSKCLTYNPGAGSGTPVWSEWCDRPGQGWRRREAGTSTTGWQLYQYVAVETADYCLSASEMYGGQRSGVELWTCGSPGKWVRWW